MKITNGDKITIKNIGKVAVDIPTFKHNFSYRLSGGESLVFPTKSVEQSLFYLKQKNKILQVTLGNGGEAALVPFQVGQCVSAIKVDTNAKTNEELAAFAAQLDSGSGIENAFMTYLAYGYERPIITVQGSADFGYMIQTTSNDADDVLVWVSKAMDVDSLKFESAGWYLDNETTGSVEKVSGIVELQPYETTIVYNIDTSFSELNGTVFGVVKGEAPQGTLTPFRVGQHINGVTIDPTAKTDEEIINWLNGLTNEQHLVECSDGGSGVSVNETNGIKTLSMFLNPIWVNFAADNISTGTSMPKGWSYMTQASGGADITPITEKTTLNFDTLEVTQVYSEFDFLNGVVVGAVEATNVPDVPQETLTPFSKGQNINAIKVNTNAKTNDELSTFAAKALEGQGNTKTLVDNSNGNIIVRVQGSAESGYIIKAAIDTNNNILWVSKGLDLDAKTFPSAGWYLVNETDSTFSETSGVVELSFTETVTVGENIDATFNSELNGTVFGVVAA